MFCWGIDWGIEVYKSTYSHIYSKESDGTWSRSDPIDEHITTTLEKTGSDFQSYVSGVADFKSSEKISPVQSYANQIDSAKNGAGYLSLIAGVAGFVSPDPTVSKGLGVTSIIAGSSVFLSSNPENLKLVKNF